MGRFLSEAEIIELRPRAEIRFLREVAGPEHGGPCLEAFYRFYEELHPTHFEGIYEGVPELLRELRARELPLGLVTGKSRRSWEITRRHVDLGPFHVEVMDDDVPRQKPDPAGVLRALRSLEAPPERVVYVGDSLTDMEAAKEAGIRAAAVLWCKKEEERALFREAAEGLGAEIVPTPGSLARILGAAPV